MHFSLPQAPGTAPSSCGPSPLLPRVLTYQPLVPLLRQTEFFQTYYRTKFDTNRLLTGVGLFVCDAFAVHCWCELLTPGKKWRSMTLELQSAPVHKMLHFCIDAGLDAWSEQAPCIPARLLHPGLAQPVTRERLLVLSIKNIVAYQDVPVSAAQSIFMWSCSS